MTDRPIVPFASIEASSVLPNSLLEIYKPLVPSNLSIEEGLVRVTGLIDQTLNGLFTDAKLPSTNTFAAEVNVISQVIACSGFFAEKWLLFASDLERRLLRQVSNMTELQLYLQEVHNCNEHSIMSLSHNIIQQQHFCTYLEHEAAKAVEKARNARMHLNFLQDLSWRHEQQMRSTDAFLERTQSSSSSDVDNSIVNSLSIYARSMDLSSFFS